MRIIRPVSLEVVRPITLLVALCTVAATCMFGLAVLWWFSGSAWYYWSAWLDLLKVGALLSLVAFIGSWLGRH